VSDICLQNFFIHLLNFLEFVLHCSNILIFHVQQEIVVVLDATVRTYYEKTKSGDRTPKGVHDSMTLAAIATIKGFQIEFDKQSTITNPKNGAAMFLEEVCNFHCLQMDGLHDYFWSFGVGFHYGVL